MKYGIWARGPILRARPDGTIIYVGVDPASDKDSDSDRTVIYCAHKCAFGHWYNHDKNNPCPDCRMCKEEKKRGRNDG